MAAEIRQILIDGYPIDVAKVETHSLEAEVTEHPVERGSTITDHVRLNPIEVTLECVVSDTPLGAIAADPTRINSQIEIEGEDSTAIPTPSEDAYTKLKAIRLAREPVTIETSLDRFENMILTRLTIPRNSDTSGGLTFEATFREVVIVENLRVTVRVADPRGNSPTDIGLKVLKTLEGKRMVWRRGLPPGTSPETTPSGVILFLEFVDVENGVFVHDLSKIALGPAELAAFTKDMQRDEALQKKRNAAINKDTGKLKSDIAKANKLLADKNSNPGKYVDPSLFGL
jgi:hypothetical protein